MLQSRSSAFFRETGQCKLSSIFPSVDSDEQDLAHSRGCTAVLFSFAVSKRVFPLQLCIRLLCGGRRAGRRHGNGNHDRLPRWASRLLLVSQSVSQSGRPAGCFVLRRRTFEPPNKDCDLSSWNGRGGRTRTDPSLPTLFSQRTIRHCGGYFDFF